MTYPSFLSPYGPGPKIKKIFEKSCQCQLQWIRAEDSSLMVQRLSLRKDGMGVDVVLGLDQVTWFLAQKSWKWKNIFFKKDSLTPLALSWTGLKPKAVPIAWSPLSFISKKKYPTMDLNFLIQNKEFKNQISLPHPRTSTLGLQFYFWIFSTFKEEQISEFLKKFKNQIYNVSHSWSSSYSLFQKNFSFLTWSYQTSLMYHQKRENKKYFILSFKEKHPYQVEYVAIPKTCRQCQIAQQFIEFLLTQEVQKILMNKNYMLPVVQGIQSDSYFNQLKKIPLISYEKMPLFLSKKSKWMDLWDEIFY